MPDESTPDPAPDTPNPPPRPWLYLPQIYQTLSVRLAERNLFDAIARCTRNAIFATPIEGKHICFTGSVPFAREHLEQWVETLGAFATPDRLDIALADWFVLGRINFDDSLVEALVRAEVRFFSQEEFLSLLLFGEEATARNLIDSTLNPHPGLEWVEQCEWNYQAECEAAEDPEPSEPIEPTEVVWVPRPPGPAIVDPVDDSGHPIDWTPRPPEPNGQPSETIDGLNVESELMKLGYSVAKHVPLSRRQQSLDLGVQLLGLPGWSIISPG